MDNNSIRQRQWMVDYFKFLMKKPMNFYTVDPESMPANYYNMFAIYIKFYYEISYLANQKIHLGDAFWRTYNIHIQNIAYALCIKWNINIPSNISVITYLQNIIGNQSIASADITFFKTVCDFMLNYMNFKKSITNTVEEVLSFDSLVMSVVSHVFDEIIEYDEKLVTNYLLE